jgi:hypothetical protein
VRQLVTRRGFERVREGVPQVEHPARPFVVRIAQAHGRLEGGAAPDELGVRQRPDRLAHQEARLDDLRHPVQALVGRQRLDQRRIDDGPDRPVEGADEVLALRDVDRGLASDRRVDLTHERSRHRHPGAAASEGGGGETGGVGQRAAAERQKDILPLDPQRAPQPLDLLHGLGALARRQLVHLREPLAEGELCVCAVDPCDDGLGDERHATFRDELAEPLERADLDVNACRCERDVASVAGARVGDLLVQGHAPLVATAKLGLVACQRPVALPNPLPRRVHIDLEKHVEREVRERGAREGRLDDSAAGGDHRPVAVAQQQLFHQDLGLQRAKAVLAVLRKDLRDRRLQLLLDHLVEVEELPVQPSCHLTADRRLAGSHEADEDDVLL